MSFKEFLLPYIGLAIWLCGALVGIVFILVSAFSKGNERIILFWVGVFIMIFSFIFGKYLKHKFKESSGMIVWHGRY